MAEEVLVTTGSGFEGYNIVSYDGFIASQAILGSNFIKGLAANVSDVAEKDMAKLEKCRETAEKRLIKACQKKKANAIIGMRMTYADFSAGSFGIIASGTAVEISKQEVKDSSLYKELYVSNYYTRVIPRPVQVILSGDGRDISMKMICFNYNHEDVLSVRTDVEFFNLYDEKLVIKNVDFVFTRNNNQSIIESEFVDCNLSVNDFHLLKDVKIIVNKYATPRGVYACNDSPMDVEMSLRRLENLKQKRGIDAVAKYRSDGMIWTCNCGHVNEAGAEECIICGRKQKDMRVVIRFDYEEMVEKMKEKEYVIEIKDVLMEYIKDIDAKYRMPLLEIMESGLQYEKTRGNMKETVIEKVEKVFEDDDTM